MEGPYSNPDEVYTTVCGVVFENWGAAEWHERYCPECQSLKHGGPERDED